MKKKRPEDAIIEACVEYLEIQCRLGNVKDFHHSPNETDGPVQWKVKRKRQGVSNGFPDLLIYLPSKTILHAEVKAPRQYPDTNQKKWRDTAEELGFPWALIRSVDDLEAAIAKVRLGDLPRRKKAAGEVC